MKGTISIGKVTCGGKPENDYVSISIEDDLSTISFVEVKIGLEDFARALFGLSGLPVEFELRGLDKVGKRFEHKTEEIAIITTSKTCTFTDREIRQAVRRYEIDGWIGSDRDARNHHKRVRNDPKGNVYQIHFVRWVKEKDVQ